MILESPLSIYHNSTYEPYDMNVMIWAFLPMERYDD